MQNPDLWLLLNAAVAVFGNPADLEKRALAATRKRHAHIEANKKETNIRNGQPNRFQNEKSTKIKSMK